MAVIHIYATADARGGVLCRSNTVGAAIRLDKLRIFGNEEICRECLTKANEALAKERG